MDKGQVAEVLVSIATLLELKGENPFKSRAYLNAARTIETLSKPLDKMVAEARLGELKGGDGAQFAVNAGLQRPKGLAKFSACWFRLNIALP